MTHWIKGKSQNYLHPKTSPSLRGQREESRWISGKSYSKNMLWTWLNKEAQAIFTSNSLYLQIFIKVWELLVKEGPKVSLVASSRIKRQTKVTCLLHSVVLSKKKTYFNFLFFYVLLHAMFSSFMVGTAQVNAVYVSLAVNSYISNTRCRNSLMQA